MPPKRRRAKSFDESFTLSAPAAMRGLLTMTHARIVEQMCLTSTLRLVFEIGG